MKPVSIYLNLIEERLSDLGLNSQFNWEPENKNYQIELTSVSPTTEYDSTET